MVPETSFFTSDFNVELGLMRTDEELTKMYGPLCWQGYDEDPGGLKKNDVAWNYERI